jgi:hypothetical protein
MNQHRSDGAPIFDGVVRNQAVRDSRSLKGSQTADAEEAFDHNRFPNSFYPGVIVSLDRVRGRGVVRSYSGREIRFEFPFVSVVGAALGGRAPGIDLIHQGDRVGFDVGWTSKGLRVTTIKPAAKEESSE